MADLAYTADELEYIFDNTTRRAKYKDNRIMFYHMAGMKNAEKKAVANQVAGIVQLRNPDRFKNLDSKTGASFEIVLNTEADRDWLMNYLNEKEVIAKGPGGDADLTNYSGREGDDGEDEGGFLSGNTATIVIIAVLIAAIIGVVIWKRRKKH